MWDVCGLGDTKDNTLVRKPDALYAEAAKLAAGEADPTLRSKVLWDFTSGVTGSCQWDVLPQDSFDDLGSHTIDAGVRCGAVGYGGVCWVVWCS